MVVHISPESLGATQVDKIGQFDLKFQPAVAAVVEELKNDGENPPEFFAVIKEEAKKLVFQLWHESAFLPENQNTLGNPGGKCRDFEVKIPDNEVLKKWLWE